MCKKILVVDDDISILDAVSMILEDHGYDVRGIQKGEDSYQQAEIFQPHLILLDVLMSGKDGREICKNLKSENKTKNIPIVMFSAHPSAKKGMKEYGADDFLAKPFGTNELLKIVSKFTR